MLIYLHDPAGVLSGPVEIPITPGIGVQLPGNAIELAKALPKAGAGKVWALVAGQPQQLADHRGTVYSTSTGAEQYHAALGDLPEGLTALPWPGRHYAWSGREWVLDTEAQAEEARAIERAWRNDRIAECDYLAMPDYPISTEQRAELYAYRKRLRDWPAAGGFPELQKRPQPPGWFAELTP
ncbi:phage tail assembly chaperone [Pseudomonas sp. Irchel 3F5]|uniref:phage tail assembly chaperone n=1 Tax=Pseudomonas sp. Irchel 3F5 TaxID=2009002 RepID=UPI000BA48FE2|nr:phage tail assembly chaperone [Pseudomonas sp. Irchel 3F5]